MRQYMGEQKFLKSNMNELYGLRNRLYFFVKDLTELSLSLSLSLSLTHTHTHTQSSVQKHPRFLFNVSQQSKSMSVLTQL